MSTENFFNERYSNSSTYEQMVISSALWAAVGDALGWTTELATNLSNIKFRTGVEKVNKTLPWKRNINGRQGISVNFPAGTYSDDTQLRLSVCRAIRGDGTFDVEAFAKIELTVWPAYALGGGIGTKTAASNLSRKGVTWFSNFFEKGDSKYINGGGNGAAMRIQPHVWASKDIDTMLLNILRDSLVTHGHTHGFCGSIFHGLCLYSTLKNQKISDINSWREYTKYFYKIPELLEKDPQLASFWLPTWEERSGITIQNALENAFKEINQDITRIENLFHTYNTVNYEDILDCLGCRTDKYRGSGLKTALAASALAFISQELRIEEILILVANELHSDTDTIATMVGAIVGSLENRLPEWDILDRSYITAEASRLARIASGKHESSFEYPDPAKWVSPSTQASAVVNTTEGLSISGLGSLKVIGERYDHGNFSWQWFELPFGQTIFAKFKKQIDSKTVDSKDLFRENRLYLKETNTSSNPDTIKTLIKEEIQPVTHIERYTGSENEYNIGNMPSRLPHTIDSMTDEVIRSNFDEKLLGHYFNYLIDHDGSLEQVIAFSAILAKAKLARNRKKINK